MSKEQKPQDANEAAIEAVALTAGLAAKLARAIFEVGDEPMKLGGPTQRLQFMGGRYPDAEKDMGGLNEASLTAVIARALAANV